MAQINPMLLMMLLRTAPALIGTMKKTFEPEIPPQNPPLRDSSWATNDDMIALAERKLANPNIVEASAPALESAANMYNAGLGLNGEVAPVPSYHPGVYEGFSDADLDAIHAGDEEGVPEDLKKLYRKLRR